MKQIISLIQLLVILLLFQSSAQAEKTMIVRVNQPFEETLDVLKTTLQEYGYSVAHIQRCDGGMKNFGYTSDFYRVVFFGKIEEVRNLSEEFPEIVPYLPLKILIFAEQNDTLMVSLNPDQLARYFKSQKLKTQLKRWHNDLRSIFEEMTHYSQSHGS